MSTVESRSDNRIATLGVLSNANDGARVALWADPTTHRLLADVSISSLTVTDIEDGTGDSVMDAANDALRVNVVAGASNTQYAVDAALGSTPTGTLAIAIRDDALSALTPVEGDAVGLRVDANGALWTHDDALDAALAGSERSEEHT